MTNGFFLFFSGGCESLRQGESKCYMYFSHSVSTACDFSELKRPVGLKERNDKVLTPSLASSNVTKAN